MISSVFVVNVHDASICLNAQVYMYTCNYVLELKDGMCDGQKFVVNKLSTYKIDHMGRK